MDIRTFSDSRDRPSWAQNHPSRDLSAASRILDFCYEICPAQTVEIARHYNSDDSNLPTAAQDSVMIIARYNTDLSELWIGVRKVKNKMEQLTWMPFQWFVGSEAAGRRVRDKFCVEGRLDEGKVVEAWNASFGKNEVTKRGRRS
jgi:predicted transcriptional regulator with HTH domain